MGAAGVEGEDALLRRLYPAGSPQVAAMRFG